jgi:hypothetical protein
MARTADNQLKQLTDKSLLTCFSINSVQKLHLASCHTISSFNACLLCSLVLTADPEILAFASDIVSIAEPKAVAFALPIKGRLGGRIRRRLDMVKEGCITG